jgi:hypothetical protein
LPILLVVLLCNNVISRDSLQCQEATQQQQTRLSVCVAATEQATCRGSPAGDAPLDGLTAPAAAPL